MWGHGKSWKQAGIPSARDLDGKKRMPLKLSATH